MSQRKNKNSTFRRLQEVYSRLRDTSILPRDPEVLGHQLHPKEKLHTMLKRLKGKRPFSLADRAKMKAAIAHAYRGRGEINPVDTARLNSINTNDLHTQRQIVRNRKAQAVRKIVEEIRSKKVVNVTWYNPANQKWETKKSETNHPSKMAIPKDVDSQEQ